MALPTQYFRDGIYLILNSKKISGPIFPCFCCLVNEFSNFKNLLCRTRVLAPRQSSDSLAPLWYEDDHQQQWEYCWRTINQTTTVNPIQMPFSSQKLVTLCVTRLSGFRILSRDCCKKKWTGQKLIKIHNFNPNIMKLG